MRAIGVHVCPGCGAVLDTIGEYLTCRDSHPEPEETSKETPS